MSGKWEIVYYKNAQGELPVFEFIQSLNSKEKGKVINVLDLLREHGITVGAPHVKKLKGTDLWEIRTLGEGNVRIFYVTVVSKKFLLLHGFKKKKQKTDRKEIELSLNRFMDYKSRL